MTWNTLMLFDRAYGRTDETSLCIDLNNATQLRKSGRAKRSLYTVNGTDLQVSSWKFNEWDYSAKCVLPCNARGLFTYNDETVVARGYDKFFNVGEVSLTKYPNLLEQSKGPYTVTLKENGCIILIGALPGGKILVTSKHSTGIREGDVTRNHAVAGEERLALQLESVDHSLVELATFLYDNNVTAVAELCDDSFEEHVLPYAKKDAGLYLHGLNYNTRMFHTVPMPIVNQFAQEWGFRVVESLVYEDCATLFDFLNECALTGTFDNREVEGFVIRCTMRDHDFFFKYKFEQPYLLYRQFREVTRAYITSGLERPAPVRVKTHASITQRYLEYAAKWLTEEPGRRERFMNGYGIIEVRTAFIESLKLSSGMSLLSIADDSGDLASPAQKLVFVPVATIGCGKTTVFHTLQILFSEWNHLQNDDISHNSRVKLAEACVNALVTAPIVLADRNNSLRRERLNMLDGIASKGAKKLGNCLIDMVAVDFVGDVDRTVWWKTTKDRVLKRGDDHQSIKAQSDAALAERIMRGFMGRYQPIDTKHDPDARFDHVISLQLVPDANTKDPSLANVHTIINWISANYPHLIPNKPTKKQVNAAFAKALAHKPGFTKMMGTSKGATAPKPPSYIALGVESSFMPEIQKVLADDQQWLAMNNDQRLQRTFHVTLAHVAESRHAPSRKSQWKRLLADLNVGKAVSNTTKPLKCFGDVTITRIVVSHNELACLEVGIGQINGPGEQAIDFGTAEVDLADNEKLKADPSVRALKTAQRKSGDKAEDIADVQAETTNDASPTDESGLSASLSGLLIKSPESESSSIATALALKDHEKDVNPVVLSSGDLHSSKSGGGTLSGSGSQVKEFAPPNSHKIYHITLATALNKVRPMMSNEVLRLLEQNHGPNTPSGSYAIGQRTIDVYTLAEPIKMAGQQVCAFFQ